MPPPIRPAMLALAGFHLALTLIGALAANFADGGDPVSRLLLTVAFPAAAIVLVVFAAIPRPSRPFALAVAFLMAVNLALAAGIALAIAAGGIPGTVVAAPHIRHHPHNRHPLRPNPAKRQPTPNRLTPTSRRSHIHKANCGYGSAPLTPIS